MNRTQTAPKFLPRALVLPLFAGLFFFSFAALAQEGDGENRTESRETSLEAEGLNRLSPRATVKGFLNAVGQNRYDLATGYLDFTVLGAVEDSASVARDVEAVFTRGNIQPAVRISDQAGGDTKDNFPPGVDRIGEIETGEGLMDILLQKREGVSNVPVWLISAETVAAARGLGSETMAIDRVLPGWFEGREVFGAPLGHWIAALILIALSYLFAWGLVFLLRRLLPLAWKRAGVDPAAGIVRAFTIPAALYAAAWFFVFISRVLGLSIVLRQKLEILTTLAGAVALLMLLWKLSQFIANFTQDRLVTQGNLSGVSVVVFLRKASKAAIVVIAVLALLRLMGVDVTAGLAALGIGGIALALGAQKTVENFVGGIMLITDRPVRVGDFCQVGEISGTVESIGMRSTRIRTGERTVVTIPNGQFSSEKIENFAFRDRFLFNRILELNRDTSPDQVRYLLVELQSLLYAYKLVANESARVRLIHLDSERIEVEINSYIITPTFDEFLAAKEDLLLRIMDILRESGIREPLPGHAVFVSREGAGTDENAARVEAIVEKWRQEGELPLPRFPQEKIDNLQNSIDFPPKSSDARG